MALLSQRGRTLSIGFLNFLKNNTKIFWEYKSIQKENQRKEGDNRTCKKQCVSILLIGGAVHAR